MPLQRSDRLFHLTLSRRRNSSRPRGLSFSKCRDALSLGRLAAAAATALLALTLAAALDRIDVTVRTRWQQLVCAFLWLPVGARRISATAMVADW